MTLYSWFKVHANATSQDKVSLRRVKSINSCNCSMWPVALVGKNLTNRKNAKKT